MELPESEAFSVSCKPYGNKLIISKDGCSLIKPEKEIAINDISEIKYFPGIPLLLCPVLTIIHKNSEKTLIGFHGTIPRLFTGFSKPSKAIKLLREFVKAS